MMSALVTLLVALMGCSEPESPANGTLEICLSGPSESFDVSDPDIDVSGTVTRVDGDQPDWNLVWCSGASHQVEITDDAGDIWTVGLTVTLFDTDLTPIFDVQEGQAIDLTFRHRLVWGTVDGFTLESEDGLIAAVEGGFWGGALEEEDTPGLAVALTGDPIYTEESKCTITDTYLTLFAADDSSTVEPMVAETITIDGNAYVAMPIAAYEVRDGKRCSVSDNSGSTSWIVHR